MQNGSGLAGLNLRSFKQIGGSQLLGRPGTIGPPKLITQHKDGISQADPNLNVFKQVGSDKLSGELQTVRLWKLMELEKKRIQTGRQESKLFIQQVGSSQLLGDP